MYFFKIGAHLIHTEFSHYYDMGLKISQQSERASISFKQCKVGLDQTGGGGPV